MTFQKSSDNDVIANLSRFSDSNVTIFTNYIIVSSISENFEKIGNKADIFNWFRIGLNHHSIISIRI